MPPPGRGGGEPFRFRRDAAVASLPPTWVTELGVGFAPTPAGPGTSGRRPTSRTSRAVRRRRCGRRPRASRDAAAGRGGTRTPGTMPAELTPGARRRRWTAAEGSSPRPRPASRGGPGLGPADSLTGRPRGPIPSKAAADGSPRSRRARDDGIKGERRRATRRDPFPHLRRPGRSRPGSRRGERGLPSPGSGRTGKVLPGGFDYCRCMVAGSPRAASAAASPGRSGPRSGVASRSR